VSSGASHWESSEALLKVATDRAVDDPVVITIRALLSLWGAQARGSVYVSTIRNDLRRAGLTADPDFAVGHIDNLIRLVPVEAEEGVVDEAIEVSLKVGNIRAASQGVLSVNPDDSVDKAKTIMMLHDYSQLAVLSSPRALKGAVSWESMGRRALARDLHCVRDATESVEEVNLEDDLLPLLPRVAAAGFLIVRARDNTMSGIVTVADVTEEFDSLASPFFLLGELERRLRLVIAAHCDGIELGKYRDPDDPEREVSSVDSLALGEITRILEHEDIWRRLGWHADRISFIQTLHQVRQVRNRLMHFSPDLPTGQEINQMRHLLKFIRSFVP